MRRSVRAFLILTVAAIVPTSTALASRLVPPPPPPSVAPGVVPTQEAPSITGRALARARGIGRAAMVGQTTWVWQDSLETDSSPDHEGGFTHYDASGKPTAWHIDTVMACQGHAMWCGMVDSSWIYDSNRAGYGNDWDQTVSNTVDLSGVTSGTPVTLSFTHHFDAEPNYDYGYVEMFDPDQGWTVLRTFTGQVNLPGTCDTVSITVPDSLWIKFYTNGLTGPVPFRFHFTSDIGYSSEDGLYNGDGWVIDNVTVAAGGTVKFFDDFENGMGSWVASTAPGVGDYFVIRGNVVTEDICASPHGNVWTDWDPVSFSLVPRLDNFVVTPAVAVNRASSVFTAFDVYRNLPLDDCYFYHLNFRTKNAGDADWSGWIDPTYFVYYGANKDWLRQTIDLSGAAGHDSVQVELGLRDYGDIFCGGSSSGANISALFDNVAVGIIADAPPSFDHRDLDLYQSTFETTPFMYRDDNFNTPLGDSVVVQVNASHGYKNGYMYYRLNGGSFNAVPLQICAPALPTHRFADVPAGSYPANTTVEYYFAATDSLNQTSYLPAQAPTALDYYSASILPVKSATNPTLGCTDSLAHILFVNHFAGREPEPYMATALRAWGFKFDTWNVNGPSSGIGNCLGGSPTPGTPQYYWPATDVTSLLQYSTIVWNSGNLSEFTITPEDEAVIESWIQQSGRSRNFWITGDDVAYELSTPGKDYNNFMAFTCGVQFVRNDWENAPKDTLEPFVAGVAGSPTHGLGFHLNGGCPLLNDFDLIQLSSSAPLYGKAGALLYYPNGQPAATRYATQYVTPGTDSARVVFQGFSINYLEEGGQRLQLVQDVVQNYFQETPCYAATGIGEGSPETGAPAVPDALMQNAPNPFNPETTIGYSVSRAGRVEIRIYGVGGRLVRRFVTRANAPGRYSVRWNGRDDSGRQLSSGVYFYEIQTEGGFRASRKLIMLK